MYFFTVVNPDTLNESRMTVGYENNGIVVNDTKLSYQQAFEFGVMLTAMGLTEMGIDRDSAGELLDGYGIEPHHCLEQVIKD